MRDSADKIRYQPANFLDRLYAYIIDLSLITLVSYLTSYLISFISTGSVDMTINLLKPENSFNNSLLVFFFIALYFIYNIYCEKVYAKTIGKQLIGLKVISLRHEDQRLSLIQCFIRVFSLLFFQNSAIALVLFTEKRQRVGDLLANTQVVYEYPE